MQEPRTIKHLIFDWGNTLMVDFPEKPGPMCDWDINELFDLVPETLSELSKKFTLSVATNAGVSDTFLMRKALKRGNIEHYFTNYFSSKDLGYNKPDTMFFSTICSKTGFQTNESIMIGNDYEKDIIGAANAGLTTILFNHENKSGDFKKANFVIYNFGELLKIIQ